MHLVEQYALAMGARISKPFIETNYYPIPFDNYIVVENGYSDVKSRIYGMWPDVILEIKSYLDERKIAIVQIGHQDSEQIPGSFDLRGKTTSTQQSYILKKSLLHCGTNDFLLDVASNFDVPVVAMYGNTFADVAKPYWGDESKKVILESHRDGKKPSFLAEENPRTINLINPEDIAYGILKLLNINKKATNKTYFVGDYYNTHILEAVPDFSPPNSFQPGMVINLRMDYHFDLQNMINWSSNNKVNIFTNKVIDLNYLNAIKHNIISIQQEVCSELNVKYLNILKSLKINCELFTKNERALGRLRMKYFDYKVSLKKDKTKQDAKGKLDNLPENCFFKSNKLLFSNKKKYLSKYDYIIDRDYTGEDHKIVDDPKFWHDLDHIRIYEKSVDNEG